MGKYSAKQTKKPNNIRRTALILALLLLLATAGTGTLLARYVTRNKMQAEMIAAGFHISSDYLKEGGETYPVTNWGSGIEIEVYNYEIENVTQVSERNMSYDITVSNGWTVKRDNNEVTSGLLEGDGTTKQTHKLVLEYTGSGTPTSVDVTVKTTSPYTKTLKATFQLSGSNVPSYTLKDEGNHVVLTINSNDFAGQVTVNWQGDLAPDNTNQYMTTWTGNSGTLTVEPFHIYELILVGTGNNVTIQY